jgi:phospholipid-binding lipoprotein MlaA
MRAYSAIVALSLFILLPAGCAMVGKEEKTALRHEATVLSLDDDDRYLDEAFQTQVIPDPLEPWNRAVFTFNDVLLVYVAHPISDAYTFVMPEPFRNGIGNFFRNLLFPVRFLNNVFQGNGEMAYKEFARFVINTGAGLGGFWDVASTEPALQNMVAADFGQTLGKWGFGEGVYLYWPLLGPSNVRDTVGTVGDLFMDPLTYVRPWRVSLPLKALRTVNELDGILDLYDDLTRSAIEPYTAVRDGYTQYRRAKIEK